MISNVVSEHIQSKCDIRTQPPLRRLKDTGNSHNCGQYRPFCSLCLELRSGNDVTLCRFDTSCVKPKANVGAHSKLIVVRASRNTFFISCAVLHIYESFRRRRDCIANIWQSDILFDDKMESTDTIQQISRSSGVRQLFRLSEQFGVRNLCYRGSPTQAANGIFTCDVILGFGCHVRWRALSLKTQHSMHRWL